MAQSLCSMIETEDPAVRDTPLDVWARDASVADLMRECEALDRFRRESDNLYQRVRALFFLYAIHRFLLPPKLEQGGAAAAKGAVPFEGYSHLLSRRFEEAIETFLSRQAEEGPSDAISSALAAAYKDLAFSTLANQVRRSVRSVRGNQWMFRIGHPADQPPCRSTESRGSRRRRVSTRRRPATPPRAGRTTCRRCRG